MDWTPRRKSIAFTLAVFAIAGGLVAAGLVSASGILSPIRDGRDWWQERSLTHHTRSLAVHVGQLDGESAAPVEGAQVSVERVPVFAQGEEPREVERTPAHTLETDAEGRAVFELEVGEPFAFDLYRVRVVHGAWSAEHDVPLDEDVRVRAYFDAEGAAAWRWTAHRDLVAGHGEASVTVGIVDWRYCRMAEQDGVTLPTACADAPAPGVVIHRVRDGARAERVDVVPRVEGGTLRFELELGLYDLVVSYEGQEVAERLHLACDWERLHQFDGATLTLEPQESCGGWTSGGAPRAQGPPPR